MADEAKPNRSAAIAEAIKDAGGTPPNERENREESDEKILPDTVDKDPLGDGKEDEDKTSKDEDKKADADDEEAHVKEALSVYKLLKDPETSRATLKEIAEIMGMKFAEENPQATKTETKEAAAGVAKALDEVLKEALGDEYAALPPGIGSVLEKFLKSAVEEAISPIKAELSARQEREVRSTAETAYARATKEIATFETNIPAITKLVKEFPYSGPDGDVDAYLKYFKRMNNLADAESGNTSDKASDIEAKRKQRVRENLGTDTRFGNGVDGSDAKAPKRPTREQAIKMTLRQAGFQLRDE